MLMAFEDPAKPNEYEFCKAEAKRRKKEEKERKLMESERRFSDEDDQRSDGSIDGMPMRLPDQGRESEPAPSRPTILNDTTGDDAYRRRMEMSANAAAMISDKSGEDAYMRRMMMSSQQGNAGPTPLPTRQESNESMVNDEDDEYDDDLDGVPLQLNKEEDDNEDDLDGVPLQPSGDEPSHVILLRNLVGPGEVDASLEDETASECSKYGHVEEVRIFEVMFHIAVLLKNQHLVPRYEAQYHTRRRSEYSFGLTSLSPP
ncbi:hypothetical protein HDU97_008626 [Phlyctochytrium planicorne]|nr:hypothetical protein HDU97_008626 [Phlyctochytrium planicorne]